MSPIFHRRVERERMIEWINGEEWGEEEEEEEGKGFYLRIVDNPATVSVSGRTSRSVLKRYIRGDSWPRGGTRSGKSIEHRQRCRGPITALAWRHDILFCGLSQCP